MAAEPMTLGSPPQSPPGVGNESGFAPSFLLGNSHSTPSHNTPPIRSGGNRVTLLRNSSINRQVTWSPELVQTMNYNNNNNNNPSGGVNFQHLQQQTPPPMMMMMSGPNFGGHNTSSAQQQGLSADGLLPTAGGFGSASNSKQQAGDGSGSSNTRIRGPPLRSLVSSTTGVPSSLGVGATNTTNLTMNDSRSAAESTSFYNHQQINDSNTSASAVFNQSGGLTQEQIDPFYTQGDEFDPNSDIDPTCVTVFGFNPSVEAMDYILKEFTHLGTVLSHVKCMNTNWLHIKYETALQAKKALGKNSRIFNGKMMIGVVICIDKVRRLFEAIQKLNDISTGTSADNNNDQDIVMTKAIPPWLNNRTSPAKRPLSSTTESSLRRQAVQNRVRSNADGGLPSSTSSTTTVPANKPRIRSLTNAYTAQDSPLNKSLRQEVGSPKNDDMNSSLLSQTFSYIFGSGSK